MREQYRSSSVYAKERGARFSQLQNPKASADQTRSEEESSGRNRRNQSPAQGGCVANRAGPQRLPLTIIQNELYNLTHKPQNV